MLKRIFLVLTLSITLASSYFSCGQSTATQVLEKTFSDPQDFANQEIYHHLKARVATLDSSSQVERDKHLAVMMQEAEYRVATLQDARSTLMNHDARFLDYLQSEHLPQLRMLAKKWRISPRGDELEQARAEAGKNLEVLSGKLRQALASRADKDHYLFKRLFELIAFSRSETLGDGRIGSWNPADVNTIQGSAVSGLTWVLDQIGTRNPSDVLSYDELMQWHRALLGRAEHHFSHGGMVNEIYFLNDQGQKEHVSLRVRRWLDAVNLSKGSILDSLRLYAEFLHMHPFGDSNGRIAEVGKVLVSSKSHLLPLITREKTSVENYLFQRLYGTGFYEQEAVLQAMETMDIFQAITDVVNGQPLLGVDLEGANVIFSFREHGKLNIGLINRSYLFNPTEVGMPPVRGAPVLLDDADAASSYRLRYTSDNFKTTNDKLPRVIVQTERIGRLKTFYPIFVLDIDQGLEQKSHTFQFLYNHPQAGEIFWHNNGLNYLIENPSRLSISPQ